MPYNIIFENGGLGAVITWTGDVSGEELMIAQESVYAQDQQHQLRYRIWDFSKADHLEVSNEQLRLIARKAQFAIEKKREQVAAIVGTPEFFKGVEVLSEIYAEIWSGIEMKFFFTLQEARQYIISRHNSISIHNNHTLSVKTQLCFNWEYMVV